MTSMAASVRVSTAKKYWLGPWRQVALLRRMPSNSSTVCWPVRPRRYGEPWAAAVCCTYTPGSHRSASGAERGCRSSRSSRVTVELARPGAASGASSSMTISSSSSSPLPLPSSA
jgi:hypothetical protein